MENYIQPENMYGKSAPKSRVPIKMLIFAFVILGFLWLLNENSKPPMGFVSESSVMILPGSTVEGISDMLVEKEYIKSKFLFVSLMQIFGNDRKLTLGEYYFEKPINVFGMAWQIGKGIHNVKPVRVTIPEGSNFRDISKIFSEKLPLVDISMLTQSAQSLEGYLFPETYFFFPHSSSDMVISELQNMFRAKLAKFDDEIKKSNRTEKEIIIMASIIEREAHGDSDRETIAGILWNRIDKGIPLQVDASVAYAVGKVSGLVKSDFKIDSPFNTYLYKGLPPSPISNPGFLAIKASVDPIVTDYLYYLHDKDGVIHYAKTYKEHLQNINKFLRN